MVLKPFTRRSLKKTRPFLVAASVRCQKLLVIKIVRGNWSKKVGPYLLANVYNGHNGYVLILLEMDW